MISGCVSNVSTLGANMLVGKFAEPWLLASLMSIDWVDKIIIVKNNIHDINAKQIEEFKAHYDGNKGELIVLDYFDFYNEFRFDYARNVAKEHTNTDYILKIDADEVYFDSFLYAFYSLDASVDSWKAPFLHFYFSGKRLHSIQTAEVLFKNNPKWRWVNPVHERMEGPLTKCLLDTFFAHYGYVKPQREVFKKWHLYAELENDVDRYNGVDPEHILDDNVTVEYNGPWPEVFGRYNFENYIYGCY